MRQFGLIGYPLSHSFSQGYFKDKFQHEGVLDARYANYPIASINDFKALWDDKSIQGLNITIPYKKEVIPFIQHPSSVVRSIQACNCIRRYNNELYGYNTDVIGFQKSLTPFLKPHHTNALILGTGGAAAAVEWVMKNLGIKYHFVSRTNGENCIEYNDLTKEIIESCLLYTSDAADD